jgi:sulfotransferase family protein
MPGLETLTRLSQGATRVGARLTGATPMVPAFLIVGGKRCGSTSLYEYAVRHPSVVASRVKKGTHYFDVNFPRGLGWYLSKFPTQPRRASERSVHLITGEASPYYMFHPLAPARIAAALPAVRLLAVLRDPVERAWSHYRYSVQRGFETLPIDEALDREPERLAGEAERMLDPAYQSYAHRHHTYLSRGHYAEQLEGLYALFGSERVHVLQSEAMFADPDAALQGVFEFLGLDGAPLGPVTAYKAGRDQKMPLSVRARLEAYYAEPTARLYALPSVNFRWDSRD